MCSRYIFRSVVNELYLTKTTQNKQGVQEGTLSSYCRKWNNLNCESHSMQNYSWAANWSLAMGKKILVLATHSTLFRFIWSGYCIWYSTLLVVSFLFHESKQNNWDISSLENLELQLNQKMIFMVVLNSYFWFWYSYFTCFCRRKKAESERLYLKAANKFFWKWASLDGSILG